MIGSLRGAVLERTATGEVLVEVGGVGYRVAVPAGVLVTLEPGDAAFLFTHLLVREDALTLYDFASAAELALFEQLLGVRGLGPAKALALLSGSSVEALRTAIAGENTASLTRIPGIGRRLAAQIVLDLKDKVGPVVAEGVAVTDSEVLA